MIIVILFLLLLLRLPVVFSSYSSSSPKSPQVHISLAALLQNAAGRQLCSGLCRIQGLQLQSPRIKPGVYRVDDVRGIIAGRSS